MKRLEIIIECEESQAVCKAFRAKGCNAYSCDIQDSSGGHPEWHIKGDVRQCRGGAVDLVGSHAPCTYLANSGVRWLISTTEKPGYIYNQQLKAFVNPDRWERMVEAAKFFKDTYEYIKKVGRGYIENPIMHKHAMAIIGVSPSQIIQPWQFGHGETKATCLWLVGLPKLQPTNIVQGREQRIWKLPPNECRGKERSKTFPGIAEAMANQWTEYILNNNS